MLPLLERYFSVGKVAVTLTVTATTAGVALAAPLIGTVADRFGRTKVLAASIFTFAIFTGLSAMAQNVWELGSFRFIAGIGIGGEWGACGHIRGRGMAGGPA